MLKTFVLSSVLLSSFCITWAELYRPSMPQEAIAQIFSKPAESNDLYYLFNGQRIPLSLRQDVVGVAFTETGTTRSAAARGSSAKLSRDLNQSGGGTRSTQSMAVEVKAVGNRFALVSLASETRSTPRDVARRVEQFSYVEQALPVLSREGDQNYILLPNEIIVSFDATLSDSKAQKALLDRYNLEIKRQLPFTDHSYVVQSRTASGTQVLDISNRLTTVRGVRSATPNFVQSVSYHIPNSRFLESTLQDIPNPESALKQEIDGLQKAPNTTQQHSDLLPLQWHLDSRPRRGQALPRVDVKATEAWETGHTGKEIVVAVIDSLIQWDHPNLENNLYQPPSLDNLLPGEQQYGYDFAEMDGDTRISGLEISQVQKPFQDTFKLSCLEFSRSYSQLVELIGLYFPALSSSEICSFAKNYIRDTISAEFHGTWSAGVISGRPQAGEGSFGVAPDAKILPVRVFGLGGSITPEGLASAIRYSAARGADVINMSLGGSMPHPDIVAAVFEVLDANPNLLIVASAGNENLDGVGFPAAIPGVLSVGATNLDGKRSYYSNFGAQLDIVAPGGDTSEVKSGGILTTGGTFSNEFWQGVKLPSYAWGSAVDPLGQFVQVQGTSFSGPVVAGVAALVKDANPSLSRENIISILKSTSSKEALGITDHDQQWYRLQSGVGFNTAFAGRQSGAFPLPKPLPFQEYYFGAGLIDAKSAVDKATGK